MTLKKTLYYSVFTFLLKLLMLRHDFAISQKTDLQKKDNFLRVIGCKTYEKLCSLSSSDSEFTRQNFFPFTLEECKLKVLDRSNLKKYFLLFTIIEIVFFYFFHSLIFIQFSVIKSSERPNTLSRNWKKSYEFETTLFTS